MNCPWLLDRDVKMPSGVGTGSLLPCIPGYKGEKISTSLVNDVIHDVVP